MKCFFFVKSYDYRVLRVGLTMCLLAEVDTGCHEDLISVALI